MSDCVSVLCPAKINLGLRVFPKRADGFHHIQSIFTTVNLFDELKVTVTGERNTCRVNARGMKLPEENTFTKAYKAFCVLTGIDSGVLVEVDKKIPAGGGLGGGSSDASSFIQSLNSLFKAQLSDSDLLSLAGQVGSDVFFFTSALNADNGRRFGFYSPYCAVVGGRGEIIHEIEARNDFSVLLVMPGVEVSTKEAYCLVDNAMNGNVKPFDNMEVTYRKNVADWNFVNDFTIPVCESYAAVGNALSEIRKCGVDFADMSGSGSTVFGVFEDRKKALAARDCLEKKFRCFLA